MIAWLLFGFVIGLVSVIFMLPAVQFFFDWLDRMWKAERDRTLIEHDRELWDRQRATHGRAWDDHPLGREIPK